MFRNTNIEVKNEQTTQKTEQTPELTLAQTKQKLYGQLFMEQRRREMAKNPEISQEERLSKMSLAEVKKELYGLLCYAQYHPNEVNTQKTAEIDHKTPASISQAKLG
ncbi:MAG: hypothetical protein ACYCQI_08775 [Gammaproteobacteria bacterium]